MTKSSDGGGDYNDSHKDDERHEEESGSDRKEERGDKEEHCNNNWGTVHCGGGDYVEEQRSGQHFVVLLARVTLKVPVWVAKMEIWEVWRKQLEKLEQQEAR